MRFLSKLTQFPDSVDDAIGMVLLFSIPPVVMGIGSLCGSGW